MKVEIKEIKKKRQNGFYRVKYNNKFIIVEFINGTWYRTGIDHEYEDDDFEWIDDESVPINNDKIIKKKFEPFILELTIESKEELKELWHRFNMSIGGIGSLYKEKKKTFNYEFKRIYFSNLWDKIDEMMRERNIKP